MDAGDAVIVRGALERNPQVVEVLLGPFELSGEEVGRRALDDEPLEVDGENRRRLDVDAALVTEERREHHRAREYDDRDDREDAEDDEKLLHRTAKSALSGYPRQATPSLAAITPPAGDIPWDSRSSSPHSEGQVESRRMIATVLFSTSSARPSARRPRRPPLAGSPARASYGRARGDPAPLRHEIATAGDGFLAVFDSPAHALLCAAAIGTPCALDLRSGLRRPHGRGRARGWRRGRDRGPHRCGGRALAGADEILVSGTVRDAEAGSDFGFEDRGRHELRGVAGEWRVYALTQIPEEAVGSLSGPKGVDFLGPRPTSPAGSIVALTWALRRPSSCSLS